MGKSHARQLVQVLKVRCVWCVRSSTPAPSGPQNGEDDGETPTILHPLQECPGWGS